MEKTSYINNKSFKLFGKKLFELTETHNQEYRENAEYLEIRVTPEHFEREFKVKEN